MSKQLDLPISEWFALGSKEGAQAREDWLRYNADYYQVVWRKNFEYHKVRFPKRNVRDADERQNAYMNAHDQAQFVADYLKQPIMIYAVKEIPDTENGYDSLVATVKPTIK